MTFSNETSQYGIVVLSRFPEYARNLIASIKSTHRVLPPILVVRDRNTETYPEEIFVTDGVEPFIYAVNANIGFDFFAPMDVILCNDDMTVVEKDFFERLFSVASKWPKCGILSPLIDGGVGNPFQKYPPLNAELNAELKDFRVIGEDSGSMPVCFPCVYLNRRMIDEIGLLDENLMGYGFDDNDYCIRARKAGWWTMITNQLRIKHGCGGPGLNRGYNWSLSFAREAERPNNLEYFKHKHSQIKTA